MEVEPIPEWVRRLWDAWNLRAMVLISLALEITLILLATHRRHVTGPLGVLIRSIVCSAYVMADWVAIISIPKLSDIATEAEYFDRNGLLLRVLWAPLLLMQVGGPDTITAYSMQDVHYWWSIHTLILAAPVGVIILLIYILVRRWSTHSWLSILTLTLILVGITKYAERVWALWFAKNTLLKGKSTPPKLLPEDHFKNRDIEFEAIDIELGLMYDVLYTKASVIYSSPVYGCIVRLVSFFCIVSVLLGFCIITKDEYSKVDVIITYVLLVGAVVLDIYAIILMLFSDWSIYWEWHFEKCKNLFVTPILKAIATLSSNKWEKRWSNSMEQFNLLRFSLYEHEDKKRLLDPILKFVRKFSGVPVDEKFKKYCCQTRVDITKMEAFKKLMVEQVGEITGQTVVLQPFNTRGEWTLRRHDLEVEDFQKTVQVDFDDSIIIWHIATDFCYHLDCDAQNMFAEVREISKMLSDYMMYLLVKRPHMLPIATWRSMFKSTCEDIKNKLEEKELPLTAHKDHAQVCKILLEEGEKAKRRSPWSTEYPALWHACKLTKRLNAHPKKWNIISNMWIEMLCYAGTHCLVDHHVEELRRGGEFLTHVRLLLTNFDIKHRSNRDRLLTPDDFDAYRAILDELEEFDMSSAPMSVSESYEISIEITLAN